MADPHVGAALRALHAEPARERLRDTDLRLAAIAQSLGYGSEFAFAAVKRYHGPAPGRWRAGARGGRVARAVR